MPTSDAYYMDRAARLAWRGHGGGEPNPLVGCLIVDGNGTVVGDGAHRRFGGPHAEVAALRAAGDRARGATAYVTLEPCNHHGQTPPCAEALIEAGIARVVVARRDPHEGHGGGIQTLHDAGIAVHELTEHDAARASSEPFAYRVRHHLPWVVAKWAQTLDGYIATKTGQSQWISGSRSRRMVHRERGRVDAILTGIGTVIADDPMLTARAVRVRRLARRVVIDPRLETPIGSQIARTAATVPTVIACREDIISTEADRAAQLCGMGVELLAIPAAEGELPLPVILRELVDRHDVSNVLIESGAGLLERLFRQRLVNEAWVFVAPLIFGDRASVPAVTGRDVHSVTDGVPMTLMGHHRRDDDVVLRYRVDEARG